MVARIIPVNRPQAVQVWQTQASPWNDPGEDRLIAVSVTVPQRYYVPVCDTQRAVEWPLPLLARPWTAS